MRSVPGVRRITNAADQAAVPAVAPTTIAQGVPVTALSGFTSETIGERAAFSWLSAAGGEAWRLYGWYDGAYELMEMGVALAVVGRQVQSYDCSPRPAHVCVMGPAGITAVKHYFSE